MVFFLLSFLSLLWLWSFLRYQENQNKTKMSDNIKENPSARFVTLTKKQTGSKSATAESPQISQPSIARYLDTSKKGEAQVSTAEMQVSANENPTPQTIMEATTQGREAQNPGSSKDESSKSVETMSREGGTPKSLINMEVDTPTAQEVDPQNPGTSKDAASKSEGPKPVGKNHAKNRAKKERRRLLRGVSALSLEHPEASSASTSTPRPENKRERPTPSVGSTPSTQPKKRHRPMVDGESMAGSQSRKTSGDKAKGSYSKAASSGSLLKITRREAEDIPLYDSDVWEVQQAIFRALLYSDPGFVVRIERTFLHDGRVQVVCRDDQTLARRAFAGQLDEHDEEAR